MKLEKSAGAIIWRKNNEEIEYLLIESQPYKEFESAWAFPKGHLKERESKIDAAKREVYEEIGLTPIFNCNFRKSFTYSSDYIQKQVTLFLAQSINNQKLKLQTDEIRQAKWLNYTEAYQLLQCQHYREFSNNELLNILTSANNLLEK